MELEVLLDQLKDFLKQDRIQDGIDLLLAQQPLFADQFTETDLVQLAGRLSSLKREQMLGIITADRYQAERNQLRMILIEKADALRKRVAHEPVVSASTHPQDGDLLIDEASDLYNDGEYHAAREVISRAFGQRFVRYNEAEAYAVLGNINSQLGYLQDAIDAHQQALERQPAEASYWTNLGIVYRLSAQFDKAESCYLKAIELNDSYAPIYASLGALYLTHTGQYAEAVDYLKKAIQLDPGLAIAYSNMAIAQASLGNFDAADQYLRTAVLKGYRNAKNARLMIDNLRSL